MKIASRATLLLATTAAAAATAVYALSPTIAQPARKAAVDRTTHAVTGHRTAGNADPPPSASAFAADVVATTTAYASANGETARITNVHCVEAASGRYMCSYAVARPNRAGECHIMQATWTPDQASAYTVTLSGRVSKCGSLEEAIDSAR